MNLKKKLVEDTLNWLNGFKKKTGEDKNILKWKDL